MNPTAEQFLNRLRDHRERGGNSMGRLSAWVTKHTNLGGKKYSFKDHEFQEAIIDDTASAAVVVKPSQVGLSQATVHMVLGFLATNPNTTMLYGLQTLKFSQQFAKSRIDPVIRESPDIAEMMVPGNDSSLFKQFTNSSQLHVVGFSPGSSIISVPASGVISDETDFSSAEAIATGESRLSHSPFVSSDGVRGFRRYFSTPTVSGYGVDAKFQSSDKKRRLVKCRSCSDWFWPSFFEHVVVDTWDQPISEMTALEAQVLDDNGALKSARLICPHCHNVVTQQNLAAPHREWVAEHPEVTRMSGWHCSPFDLPTYHTPYTLFRKLIDTGDAHYHHFVNFALGLPFVSALNSVRDSAVAENTTVNPVMPERAYGEVSGCVAGIDIGKTSWITIGKVIDHQLHIIYVEQIKLRAEDGSDLESRVLGLMRSYKVALCFMDSYPYTDVLLRLISRYPALKGVDYSIREKALEMMVVREDIDTVKMNRTKVLNFLVKRINTGQIKFPKMPETAVVASHLKAIRQVQQTKESGEVVEVWVETGPDHYAHALAYCNMAAQSLMDSMTAGFAMAPTIKQAEVGSKYVPSKAA